MKKFSLTRRELLLTTATMSATAMFPGPAILSAKSPNSRLNIGAIGVGGRGGGDIAELAGNAGDDLRYHSFCDVNAVTLAEQSDHYRVEHRYRDYREMLAEQVDKLDGVIVATLDHTHGIIACEAMHYGLNCYCEKPLANSVWETRQMANFAKKKQLCTQTGTQVRSWNDAHYYRAIELLNAGAIGDIVEVHNWCHGTYVPPQEPVGADPVPEWLDYDLWVGPTPFIPYNNAWLTFSKYGLWHSGNGWITGMGPHTIDLIWTALKLQPPTKIEVDGPEPHPLYSRDQLHVTWTHSYQGRELKVHWYDGNRSPEAIPQELYDPTPGAGVLFIGTEGALQVHYGYHTLFPREKFANYQPPAPTFAPSVGHQNQWLQAIKAGKPQQCECHFEYAAPYTEAAILAANMHRCAVSSVEWFPDRMTTSSPEVNALLKPTWRDGWTFREV